MQYTYNSDVVGGYGEMQSNTYSVMNIYIVIIWMLLKENASLK